MELVLSLIASGLFLGPMLLIGWTVARSRASAVLGETFNLRR